MKHGTLSTICTVLLITFSANVYAGGGGGGGGGNNNNNQQVAGVEIDPNGVLRVREFSREVTAQRVAAARVNLAPNLARRSELRKVSLTRLEDAVARATSNGGPVSSEMAALAGLTSIDYVFFYPEINEIVIAGPAEGFVADASGRIRGIDTGRPTVLLEDLVVALRAYPPGQRSDPVISVSIDPTKEGLTRMQQFLASVRGRLRPSDAARLAAGLKNSMGMQNVTFKGIPTTTHFAQVLVEADYRMKMIGIGLETPPVRMMSYVDRANPRQVSANAMERWYFMPDYECVRVSDDMLGMELVGQGVKLIGEAERVNNGNRQASGRVNKASQAFCKDFTEKYEQIAASAVVYGQLRNVIDLSVIAAFIQKQDYYGQAGWAMPVFGSEEQMPVETHTAPVQVETAVNAIWRGNTLMTPLGGGVHIQARVALNSDRVQKDESGEVDEMRMVQSFDSLDSNQWWWD